MRLLDRFFTYGNPRIAWDGDEIVAGVLRRRVSGGARWLKGRGLKPGDRVALHLPHGAAAPLLLLACWAAGLVAVRIDLNHPRDHLRVLLKRCGGRFFFPCGKLGGALARRLPTETLVLDRAWTLPVAQTATAPELDLSDDAPALILWTSGSTGEPKGVNINRAAVDTFVEYWTARLAIGPADRVSWAAALSFDLSLLDLGVALTSGATLVPVPEERLAFPADLGTWLEAQRVTCLYTVPSLLDRALPAGSALPPTLRVILSAGEALSPALAKRLRAGLGDDGLLGNLFGPTETNVSTAWFAPPGWNADVVPIGTPCPYVQVRLSDDGELLVTGDTVMSGYWAEPERATWSEHDGATWLHTGDRARWQDGELLFLGRMDRMIKIRGFRVEPEAVERALCDVDGVNEAAVTVEEADDGPLLVAYVAGEVDAEQVRKSVTTTLSVWAIPDRIEVVEALPRSPRGKVDRSALS